MYRYRTKAQGLFAADGGCLYLCCYCLPHEMRFVVTGVPGLISKSNFGREDEVVLLTHILTRTHRARGLHYNMYQAETLLTDILKRMPEARGFVAECVRSIRLVDQRQGGAINSHIEAHA